MSSIRLHVWNTPNKHCVKLDPVTLDKKANSQPSWFLQGFKACFTISLAVALFGFVFGVLANSQGLSVKETLFMSAVVFAGAAQMVSLTMWTPGDLPSVALIVTCFIICLRFLLMGAALRPHLKTLPAWQVYPALFFNADENWALSMVAQQKQQLQGKSLLAFYLGASVIFYISWLLSSWLGFLSAGLIEDPKALGIDFAFIAIFLALLVSLWRDKQDMMPWIIAIVVAIGTDYLLPGNWYIILGAIAGSVAGVVRDYK